MLNKIKFSYKVADKQEGLFTPCHTLFKCKIKIDGLQYTFNYQCNISHDEPNLKNCLNCLLFDASCYEDARAVADLVEAAFPNLKGKVVINDIGTTIGLGDTMLPGIVIGVVGLAMALLTYPIHKRILRSRRQKYAEEILTLSDKLMSE